MSCRSLKKIYTDKHKYTIKRSILALAITQALTSVNANAATLTVNTSSDIDGTQSCTLREAISSINNQSLSTGCFNSGMPFGESDTVQFSLPSNSNIELSSNALQITRSMQINGASTNSLTIGPAETENIRVFQILGPGSIGPNPAIDIPIDVSIESISIQNGSAINAASQFLGDQGGGILAAGNTNIELNNLNIYSNQAIFGGGIAVTESSEISISNSLISNNIATAGGGIAALGSDTVTIDSSYITDNHARQLGGGIGITDTSNVVITNSDISNNIARAIPTEYFDGMAHTFDPAEGGGISADNNSYLSINDSTINNNIGQHGGGIHINENAILLLENSTVSQNSAYGIGSISANTIHYDYGLGSGVAGLGNSSILILQSIINNNSRAEHGGGLLTSESTNTTISQSTITQNTASFFGGGLAALDEGNLIIFNSTISSNSITSSGFGGGIVGHNSGGVSIIHSTIAYNYSAFSTGGLMMSGTDSGNLLLINSLISANQADSAYSDFADPNGTLTIPGSSGNLFGDDSKTFAESMLISGLSLFPSGNDIIATNTTRSGGINPEPFSIEQIIKPLAPIGSIQLGHRLAHNSPAIDALDQSFCQIFDPFQDQTGFVRSDDNCDIGAIETDQSICFIVPASNGNIVTFCL